MQNTTRKTSNLNAIQQGALPAVFTSLLLGGCAVSPQTPEPIRTAQTEPCHFEQTRESAPDWVCTGYLEGVITGMGSFPPSNASYNLRFQTAEQRARVSLARQLEIKLNGALKDYESQIGAGTNETIDLVVKNLSQSKQSVSLAGSRVYASTTGPDGTLYLLVGLDEALAAKNMKRLVRSSYGRKDSEWQDKKAEQALQQLEDAVENAVNP